MVWREPSPMGHMANREVITREMKWNLLKLFKERFIRAWKMSILPFAPHIELLGAGDFLIVILFRRLYSDMPTASAAGLHGGTAGQHLAFDIHSDYLDSRLDIRFFLLEFFFVHNSFILDVNLLSCWGDGCLMADLVHSYKIPCD